jgi:mycothiol synthase
MKARSYEGMQDFHAMLDLLTQGCEADNGTHYIHRGDLQWWLFYTDVPPEIWQSRIRLWFETDYLVGWSLYALDSDDITVFVAPHLRGSPLEEEMLAWTIAQMKGHDCIEIAWVAEHDDARRYWFEQNGFTLDEKYLYHFTRSLTGSLDGPALPEGFSIRSSRGEEDARLRAACSHEAFGSTMPFEEYWHRTLRLMQSPVYIPEHEIFVIAASGEVAAYCIVWTDEVTKLGHFEPVGTHPDFQRKGLGKCLLFEGLRRLRSEGMDEADVCTNYDNPPAIGLYESVGFQKSSRLLTYRKGEQNDHKI